MTDIVMLALREGLVLTQLQIKPYHVLIVFSYSIANCSQFVVRRQLFVHVRVVVAHQNQKLVINTIYMACDRPRDITF